jgi:hypothetical protein
LSKLSPASSTSTGYSRLCTVAHGCKVASAPRAAEEPSHARTI